MSLLEIVMLLCFGFAWPFSVYKSYKSRSTQGKSLMFMGVILAGYIAGILNKLTHPLDIVIIFYLINFVLVCVDCLLYLRNKYQEKSPAPAEAQA